MVSSRTRKVRPTAGIVIFTAFVVLLTFAAHSASLSVSENGSTLILPLFKNWVSAYAKVDPDLHMMLGSDGSEAGINQAIANRVQIGTSDAYMSDTQAMAHPNILNIPLAISAQTVVANLPELRGATLKLSGPVLASIYAGTIREWDEPRIAAINQGVPLPHHTITPVRRADGSGRHFLSSPNSSLFPLRISNIFRYKISTGKAKSATARPYTGRQSQAVSPHLVIRAWSGHLRTPRMPWVILRASFHDDADKAGLQTAMLENQDGKFLLPTSATVTAAAAALTPRTPPDERLTLVFAPGPNSYPLINYEYAVVSAKQPDPQMAEAISNFLLWCIGPQGGNARSYLEPAHFIALPVPIRALSEMQIAKIR